MTIPPHWSDRRDHLHANAFAIAESAIPDERQLARALVIADRHGGTPRHIPQADVAQPGAGGAA